MATSRYNNDLQVTSMREKGKRLSTAQGVVAIRAAIKNGTAPIVRQIIATGSDRLDTLAGDVYGDAHYWWVLAAASSIGWGLQVPTGTVINVLNLSDVIREVG
jgi:hypothetical protein